MELVPPAWTPHPAVAAVIVVGADKLLLQHRDERSGIWYPGHWGLFGGEAEPGESSTSAIYRELEEELGLAPVAVRYFLDATYRFSFVAGELTRRVFEVRTDLSAIRKAELREGRTMQLFLPEAISALKLVPADRFVLDLYIAQSSDPHLKS